MNGWNFHLKPFIFSSLKSTQPNVLCTFSEIFRHLGLFFLFFFPTEAEIKNFWLLSFLQKRRDISKGTWLHMGWPSSHLKALRFIPWRYFFVHLGILQVFLPPNEFRGPPAIAHSSENQTDFAASFRTLCLLVVLLEHVGSWMDGSDLQHASFNQRKQKTSKFDFPFSMYRSCCFGDQSPLLNIATFICCHRAKR